MTAVAESKGSTATETEFSSIILEQDSVDIDDPVCWSYLMR